MENEREIYYSSPPYVKVSSIKIMPSKSLTNPKHRSVSLSVTAAGTFSSNPSTILHVIHLLAWEDFAVLQLTVPSVSLHFLALLSSSFYVFFTYEGHSYLLSVHATVAGACDN